MKVLHFRVIVNALALLVSAGGMKAIRVYLLSRNAAQEVFRLGHPRAVTPLVLGDRVLPERVRVGVLGFFFVYVATVAVGTLLIALHQVEIKDNRYAKRVARLYRDTQKTDKAQQYALEV